MFGSFPRAARRVPPPDSERARASFPSTLGPALTLLLATTGVAVAQTTERLSVSSTGVEGNAASSLEESISADGRFVAFQSDATNLVAGDTNGVRDIFVRDRATATTTRISVSSAGQQANAASFRPSISADGRWVAFESDASNLALGDGNGWTDVFLHDRVTGVTTLRSVSSAGVQGDRISYSPALSADGQWLAFGSQASTLVALANNFVGHVFLHQVATGATTLVCVTPTGALENSKSGNPFLSADGRYIAFDSQSTNLTPGLTTAFHSNVFVRDRVAGVTGLVSAATGGSEGNGSSQFASISANGRVVAFQSQANNLVPGDTNNLTDVFARDLVLGVTERVSVSSTGAQSTGGSDALYQPPGLSSDGRFVAFTSWATDLVPGAIGWQSVYLRDRALGKTSFVALSTSGQQANGTSSQPAMSSDGRFVAFQSQASNLVPGDTNGVLDMFARGPLATTWTNLGFGLAGLKGVPSLLGSGTLVTGAPMSVQLLSARPSSPALLAISTSSTPIPLYCGTLVAFPITTTIALATDATGAFLLALPSWPSGLSGSTTYWQVGVLDAAAACGVAWSNALAGAVP